MAIFMPNNFNVPVLYTEKKFEVLTELGEKTHKETRNLLNKTGRALIIRPTGFGKTRLLVNLAKEYSKKENKKRILYIYPLNIIKTEIFRNEKYMSDGILEENVDFCSYQELTLKNNKESDNYWYARLKGKYSLIILDEVHRAGADGFMQIYDSITQLLGPNKIHLVGATATPNRMMDTEDDNIATKIFENNEISSLTLADVIAAGIMKPPLYGKSMYNTDDLVKLLGSKVAKNSRYKENKLSNSGIQLLLSRYLKDVCGAEEFIINSLEQADYNLRKETYFKFIIFFKDIADVEERGPIVERWFKDAFNIIVKKRYGLRSEYKVKSHFLTSSDPNGQLRRLADEENRNYYSKTDALNSINREDRTIDLLMTVNMINMGYHVEDISGIVMLRGTKSEVIYYQQIGRCLSVLSDKRPIILDFVQNYTEMHDNKFKDIIKGKISNLQGNGVGLGNSTEQGDDRDLILEYSNIENINNAIKFVNEKEPEKIDRLIWLYSEKQAPLCVIASEIGASLYEIRAVLNKYGIKLRQEDSMVGYIEDYRETNRGLNAIMPYVYSNRVKNFLIKHNKLSNSIFKVFDEGE